METANQRIVYVQDTRRGTATDKTQQQTNIHANKNTPYQVRGPTPGHLAEGEVARDGSDFGEAKTIYVEIYLSKMD